MGLTGPYLRAPMPIVVQIGRHRDQGQGPARAHNLASAELYLLQDVGVEACGEPLGRFSDGCACEVRIARGGVDPPAVREPSSAGSPIPTEQA